MAIGKRSSIAKDYQKVLNAFINTEWLSREDITEKTGLSIPRVNQILRLLDKNGRLIRDKRLLKDSTIFYVMKRKI